MNMMNACDFFESGQDKYASHYLKTPIASIFQIGKAFMKTTIRLTLLFTFWSSLALAQLSNEAKKPTSEEQALILLEAVLAEIPTLTLPENRLHALLTAVNLIWKRDNQRGRVLLVQAINEYRTADEADRRARKENKGRVYAGTVEGSNINIMREYLLRFTGERDPQMAWESLKTTRPPKSGDEAIDSYYSENEKKIETSLILHIAGTNPNFAGQKAEEYLTQNGYYNFTEVVRVLVPTNKKAASSLCKVMLKYFKTESEINAFVRLSDLETLFLVGSGASGSEKEITTSSSSATGVVSPQLDEALLREILEVIGKVQLEKMEDTYPGSVYRLFSTPEIFKQMEKYAPAIAREIVTRMSEKLNRLSPEQRASTLDEEKTPQTEPPGNSVDTLVALAQNVGGKSAEGLYYDAAHEALRIGDLKRARQLAAHIKDASMRLTFLYNVDDRELEEAGEQGDIQKARPVLAKAYSLKERIFVLVQIAEVQFAKGNDVTARQLLTEARQELGKRMTTEVELLSQFRLAQAYAKIEPAQGFEIIEITIPRINEIISAARILDEVKTNYYFRQGELQFRGTAANLIALLIPQMAALSTLAKENFLRSTSLAAKYQRNEVQILARLSICEGLLKKQE